MQDENLIELLKEALKFYANEKNYEKGIVEKDGGHQARHILGLIQKNEEKLQTYETMFDEFENKASEASSAEDLMKMIEDLKKIE
jgi:hypothetical protein